MTTKAALLHVIRDKCLDCSCYQPGEVRLCPVTTCALWPYRFGRDPSHNRNRGFARSAVYTGDSGGQEFPAAAVCDAGKNGTALALAPPVPTDRHSLAARLV
jgi:hypothetical protein